MLSASREWSYYYQDTQPIYNLTSLCDSLILQILIPVFHCYGPYCPMCHCWAKMVACAGLKSLMNSFQGWSALCSLKVFEMGCNEHPIGKPNCDADHQRDRDCRQGLTGEIQMCSRRTGNALVALWRHLVGGWKIQFAIWTDFLQHELLVWEGNVLLYTTQVLCLSSHSFLLPPIMILPEWPLNWNMYLLGTSQENVVPFILQGKQNNFVLLISPEFGIFLIYFKEQIHHYS